MDNFGEKLRSLREKRGLTLNQLAMYSQVSSALISKIENGKRGTPKPETLEKIAKGLKIDYEELMTIAGHIENKNIDPLTHGLEPIDFSKMDKIPILGTIRAGEPLYMSGNIEGYEVVSPDVLRGRKGFILRVKGNSMSGDRIYEGDMVVCLAQEECDPSDIAVVGIDGEEATLKRVKCMGDNCILSSSNPEYQPMIYPAKHVHIFGIVEMVMFRTKK